MMFLRLLLVSREKGLRAAGALRMVPVSFIHISYLSCPKLDISLLWCGDWFDIVFNQLSCCFDYVYLFFIDIWVILVLAELKLLQDCRSRGFESHYIRLTVNIRYIDLISKVFQKFGFYVRSSVSFALSVIHIYILPFSPLDHRLLSSRRHYVQETSQLLQKPVYFSSAWGQPTFLFLRQAAHL